MNKITLKLKQHFFLLICCFVFLSINAQPQTLSEKAEISVITCGTGEEMYTLFGHTALRIQDVDQNLDVVYNWGMFDFKTPNFLAKFVKGDLLYYLDVDRFSDFVYNYQVDNRSVISQELNLTYEQKSKIWTEINRQLTSDDRYYTYSFIHNNCTTKVVDVLNKTLPQPLTTNFPSNNHSYRYILNEGLDNHYFEKLGINLLFGYATNKQAEMMFLPVKLKDGLEYNKAIVKSTENIFTANSISKSFSFNSVYTLWAIVMAIAALAMFKKVRFAYFVVLAVFSLFLVAVTFYTHHVELYFNALILFFNPLFIVALILKNKKVFIAGLFVTIASLFFMGLELIMVMLPLVVLNFVIIGITIASFKKGVVHLRA